jgi:hypothetical protein
MNKLIGWTSIGLGLTLIGIAVFIYLATSY